jgi:hypothetical protein
MSEDPLKLDRERVAKAKIKQFDVEGLGTFTIRRPTAKHIIDIGREYTRIVGGSVILDGEANYTAKVLAVLNLAEQKPDAYDGENTEEVEGLADFWAEYQTWLESFRTKQTTPTA